ncbi:MAG TPA: hybrid sensor histidine kinase/response regulator [Phyllobacterium sp.]|nr:hybrid sensor histidine kinase/response regulator [Phyllobacterium sp.]
MSDRDLSQLSMLELFAMEAQSQSRVLITGLLALERDPTAAHHLEACMRAAHSLKGAARIVGLDAGVDIAHTMEECFVAAQRGEVTLRQRQIDLLLMAVDLLTRIAKTPEANSDEAGENLSDVSAFIATMTAMLKSPEVASLLPESVHATQVEPEVAVPAALASPERVLRVTADNLNRMLGLSGESLVESHWLKPFAESLLRLKRMHQETGKALNDLRGALSGQTLSEQAQAALTETRQRIVECRQFLSDRQVALEAFESRSTDVAKRLYDEALSCRMRPFSDGARGFPRVVRDLGRTLGKQARLELVGESTQVDRDILEKLDAPLGHLLRNAVDHGIESPDERRAIGKSAEGVIRLEARHSAGMLQILVSDDGRGIDLDKLRLIAVKRGLTNAEVADKLTEAELLEFLFLPGFTMKGTVTETSGRGVGLDVVQDMVRQVRGTIRIFFQPGKGARFQLHLPLTLSVVRTLLVDISGEAYAFPLAYIVRTLKLPRNKIELLEGRQYFNFDGRPVGLFSAHQVLGGGEPAFAGDEVPVIVVGENGNTYGLIVNGFLGEHELVVQPLNAQLGKIKDIAAGALMEDGSPVLIVDVEDMLHSVDKLVSAGALSKLLPHEGADVIMTRKRVLVVDDSLTVRELERKLLDQHGYEVESAVDGMDGWNLARTGNFDLIITDVDMPRMDGIELVTLLKKDENLKSLPVMIVSYKDREEDRLRGLDAGADYYLTKGSFDDETLLQAVVDLIGEASS